MHKRLAMAAAAIVALSTLSSCSNEDCLQGSGKQATESHKTGKFTQLDISGGFQVTLRQDSSQTVKITADDNLIKNIKVDVSGGWLRVKNEKSVCNSGDMKLDIGVANLEEIRTAGAVEMQSDGKLNVRDIKLGFAGASNINLDINAANIETQSSGSADITLSGQAASHKIDFSGNGKLSAFDLVTGAYLINTAGASDCEINVLKSLKVHTTGATDIKYKGSPSEIDDNKMGASTLTKVQ